jgi:hypothetical protein
MTTGWLLDYTAPHPTPHTPTPHTPHPTPTPHPHPHPSPNITQLTITYLLLSQLQLIENNTTIYNHVTSFPKLCDWSSPKRSRVTLKLSKDSPYYLPAPYMYRRWGDIAWANSPIPLVDSSWGNQYQKLYTESLR